MKKTLVFYIILVSCLISLVKTAPKPENDILDPSFDALSNQNVDYNAVMSHFKDFFMYLPIMFTTIKETMSGFPKLAESIRILTSPNYEKPCDDDADDNDCKCKTKTLQDINDIEKSTNDFR